MTTTQAPEKTPNAFQRGVNAVIDLLSSFFLPIINLLVSVGILKGILTLLQVSGMVTDDSTTYAILNAMADSLFYFIPVFLAYTSSKRFDVDTVTAVLLGCILVYPSITTIMAADAPVYLFGLELSKATYSSSVVPILLAIYCASWVQKACYKIIPETFRGLFTPPITIIVIVPLTLAVFGPLGTVVGGWLAQGYEAVYSLSPLVAGALIGAFQLFDQVNLLTTGGPELSTTTPVYQIYITAFGSREGGYASAMAVILFFIIMAITFVTQKFMKETY